MVADTMNCLLCSNPISIFDTSAGCQDPNRSHPECDRLGAEVAAVEVSKSDDQPVVDEPAILADLATEPSEEVASPTPSEAVVDDPTEYQPPVV